MTTVADALRLLSAEKVLALVAHPRLRSLVVEIAGGPIAGSWWGHPAGKAIFAVASALEEHPDVLVAKVADGKVAFVHRDLWPALLRVLTDPARTRRELTALDEEARALLTRVRRAGELVLDAATPADRRARGELEKRLLAHSAQRHTAKGKHVAVLRTWENWAPPGAARAAAALSYDDAVATLERAGLRLTPRKPASASPSSPTSRRGRRT